MALTIDAEVGRFHQEVTVFSDSWVPLPGNAEVWPTVVKANGAIVPVVMHEERPCVYLQPGTCRLEGTYRWDEFPPSIALPREIGMLALTIQGKPIDAPSWGEDGILWLKRDRAAEETNKDFMGVKVYALVEDGIPMWLRTEIELSVSGKSREENLGAVLPEGWQLSAVDSPIPVTIDEAGNLKAQVRAGKWTVRADAFRLNRVTEIRYAVGARPIEKEELTAFRAKPELRMVEIGGAPPIDVSQTTFPDKWRDLPVYRWDTSSPIRIAERVRGMDLRKPEGLKVTRELWLDDGGGAFTFRDEIRANLQQLGRLDAAAGQDLGAVRANGEGQLITRNPQNGASGVEVRTRTVELEATGRMQRARGVSAVGWRSDANAVNASLNLPPGWRLFALFGADWVHGDWLTSWTLLDLFLLLVFTLAVFRMWGWRAAVLAFTAFGLSYHESGAPRYVWLLLLMPLALLRVVPVSFGRRAVVAWKWTMIAALVLVLLPFLAQQVQQTLYPQLENLGGGPAASADRAVVTGSAIPVPEEVAPGGSGGEQNIAEDASSELSVQDKKRSVAAATAQAPRAQNSNLAYDEKARIQTGPGVPDWNWRRVRFGWNGPVLASQVVHPILISRAGEGMLATARVILLVALAILMVTGRRLRLPAFRIRRQAAVLLSLGLCFFAANAKAEFPDQATLDALRDRLLQPSDAFPNAADIPFVRLALNGRHLTTEAEIHAAALTAVPLPGRLPAWSPISVLVDGKPESVLRRDDGYLWVALTPGVHQIRIEGELSDLTDWEWSFQLKPRRVTIDAPDWTVSGVRADGVPEQQVFFALKQKTSGGEATYEHQDLQTIANVERRLELGLVWQIHNTVTRLSPAGKAIALRIPLLPGENVVSANVNVKDGFIDARLGARDNSFSWESELSPAEHLALTTRADDSWVETWRLVASPIWNVTPTGLPPIFEPTNPELTPVWHPWPGESVELAVNRPEAIRGATVTVSEATHDVSVGKRQRVSKLALSLRCSLGEDFLIGLPASADVTSLTLNGKTIPVREDGPKLIVPLQPGELRVAVAWKTDVLLGLSFVNEEVRLPVESANLHTTIHVPEDRWTLWTFGPTRGPAVRFWGILLCATFTAYALGRAKFSPLRPLEWMLLAVGLTQVPLPAALVVVAWLFLLAWRGQDVGATGSSWIFNARQLLLILLTAISLGIFVAVVWEGLLGNPKMFIIGNGSSPTLLRWYQARTDAILPRPGFLSISIWWYRFLMLAWALWLAASLIRWLQWGWAQFSAGGSFRRFSRRPSAANPRVTPAHS